MKQIKFFLLIFSIFLGFYVQADDAEEKENFCEVTKVTMNDYEPESFITSNNLLSKAGQEPIYCGDKIIIYGKVVDQSCLPVSDAKIYIWQANCAGKYPYKPLRNIAQKEFIDIDNDSTFTGNGTATTNNKGEFIFVTTYPPAIHGLFPHINIRVEHRTLGSLQSRLNLKANKSNEFDAQAGVESAMNYTDENNLSSYNFEIVMPGYGAKNFVVDK